VRFEVVDLLAASGSGSGSGIIVVMVWLATVSPCPFRFFCAPSTCTKNLQCSCFKLLFALTYLYSNCFSFEMISTQGSRSKHLFLPLQLRKCGTFNWCLFCLTRPISRTVWLKVPPGPCKSKPLTDGADWRASFQYTLFVLYSK
jgi:hypothetical protein